MFEKTGDFDQKSKFMRISSNLPEIPNYNKNMTQAVKNNTLDNVQQRLEKDMVDKLLNQKPKGNDQF